MIFQFNQIILDTAQYRLCILGNPVSVEPLVFDFLVYLVSNRDRVVTRSELLENLWKGKVVADSALGTRLKDARKAVGDSGDKQEVIKTIHGRGYQFIADVTESTIDNLSDKEDQSIVPEALTLLDKPSIAVLPLTNISGDPEQEYLSDGITEDIITELSRFQSLFVVAHNSSLVFKGPMVDVVETGKKLKVQYLVEGSVRKAGNRIRITAQLIDTSNGIHLWGEKFDRVLDDIFKVQDEVVRDIVSTVSGRAHGRLAEYHAYSIFSLGCNIKEAIEFARTHAEKAVKLSPKDPVVLALATSAYSLIGEHKLAKFYIEKAIELNPNDFLVMVNAGFTMTYLGNFDVGLEWTALASRKNPYSSDAHLEFYFDVYYMLGQYEKAVEQLLGWKIYPVHLDLSLAAAYAQLNRMDEAHEALKRHKDRRTEDWNEVEVVLAHARMCAKPEDAERWLEGYRKVGISV